MKKYSFGFYTALFVLLTGCAHSSGPEIDQNALVDFKPGITTESEVISRLGSPNSTSFSSDGTKVDAYTSFHTKINGATFVPVVGLFAGGGTSAATMTVFTYDKNGVLVKFTNTNSNHDYSMGQSSNHN